ncbi:unnamed protein product [Cyprideis torosa]|uniref:Uncharacterized protein n=1 Tax=Cyprideis torosa TaxID=163714 RepID=A0A7R8ZMH3_9CRUS|nr:unnamed protein product [Cyprideis torosa]CAG0884343.1 unnamed protein product [Cyprideis torosa]
MYLKFPVILVHCTLLSLIPAHHVPHTLVEKGDWIDLSYPISEETIRWPGTRSFELLEQAQKNTSFYYRSNDFCTNEHMGTHMDAPSHFFQDRWTVDQVPITNLVAQAIVMDVVKKVDRNPLYQIEEEDILEWENYNGKIPSGAVLFMYSGWGARWGNQNAYFNTDDISDNTTFKFPGFHPDAVKWLVRNRNIVGLATDGPSIEYGKATGENFPAHVIVAEKNIYNLENVRNVDKLPPRGFFILVAPLRSRGGSGGPARVFAYVPKAASRYLSYIRTHALEGIHGGSSSDSSEMRGKRHRGHTHDFDNAAYQDALRVVYNHITSPKWFISEIRLEYYDMCMGEHYGSHIDSPSHFWRGSWDSSQIPAAHLLALPGVKIDVSEAASKDPNYQLSMNDVISFEQKHGQIPNDAVVFMYSGWGKKFDDPVEFFGTENYTDPKYFHFPGFHKGAIEFLIRERSVVALGVDTASIDHGQSTEYEGHVLGAKNNVIFLENVAHLDEIPSKDMTVILSCDHAFVSPGPPHHRNRVQREGMECSKKIMVCGAVSVKGRSPLVVVDPQQVKINAEEYERVLRKILPSVKRLYGEEEWIWVQDSAPSHRCPEM